MNTNIYIFIGTIAELIKLFPIIKKMEKSKINFKIIASNQNDILKSDLFSYIEKKEIIYISNVPRKQSVISLFFWFIKTLFSGYFKLKLELNKKDNSIFIIHGDTISTLIGGILGKILKSKIFHIEAGLRSFNFLRPFPEELNRFIVSFLSDVSFCPNEWAVNNLIKRKSIKINTYNNTLIESLLFSKTINIENELLRNIPEDFFICVIHRQENIYNKKLIIYLIKKITEFAQQKKCIFILHEPTKQVLKKYGLLKLLEENKNILIVGRLPYLVFTKILEKSDFIITDGGSNQEEAYYLGKTCLLLRKETERIEGLNDNVIISRLKENKINEFFNNIKNKKFQDKIKIKIENYPSDIIIEYIKNFQTY